VDVSDEQREQRHRQSEDEHAEVDGFPVHTTTSGRNTCSRRSTSSGESRIAERSDSTRRVSECLASFTRASLTSGSCANRSAPPTSQRSRLSSSVRTSEVNSV